VNAGPDTHELIDGEVRALVDEGYATARRILTEKREDLDRLAKGLLEYETLTGKEIGRVIAGLPLNRGGDGDGDGKADAGPSGIASIPKTGKAVRPARAGEDGLEPEPAG
jgi:cell division protease FtsH